ncbi:MAG: hypothetical protein EBV73_03480, partial [Rhodocyclales bacterium]|nr:hypothetical protein [Rhodocyclales bacterium]
FSLQGRRLLHDVFCELSLACLRNPFFPASLSSTCAMGSRQPVLDVSPPGPPRGTGPAPSSARQVSSVVAARGHVNSPLLAALRGSETQLPSQPDTQPGDPSGEVTVVAARDPPVRAQWRLSHRTRSAMQQLLLEAPGVGLLDFVLEPDAAVRRGLVQEWLGTQALQGKLPGCFSREQDSEAWTDWLENNLGCLLQSLFEELDELRRYRQTDNKEITTALGHINRAMSAHWRYCHH